RHPTLACIELNPPGPYPNIASVYPANVSTIYPEYWNQEFLAGVAAGLTTKTNVVGILEAYKIPNAESGANAFLLGCQPVNPACKPNPVVTNAYHSPPAETQAANSLVNSGADVLHGFIDDPTYCAVAQTRNVRAVGSYTNWQSFCPQAWVTSSIWNY